VLFSCCEVLVSKDGVGIQLPGVTLITPRLCHVSALVSPGGGCGALAESTVSSVSAAAWTSLATSPSIFCSTCAIRLPTL
jgi:hypothetical protein